MVTLAACLLYSTEEIDESNIQLFFPQWYEDLETQTLSLIERVQDKMKQLEILDNFDAKLLYILIAKKYEGNFLFN